MLLTVSSHDVQSQSQISGYFNKQIPNAIWLPVNYFSSNARIYKILEREVTNEWHGQTNVQANQIKDNISIRNDHCDVIACLLICINLYTVVLSTL